MEFIKKINPFNIFNPIIFPHEKFISSNLIIIRIYQSCKDFYYSLTMTLPKIIISKNDLVLIEKILNNFYPIPEELHITSNYLCFIAKNNNKTDPDTNLNIILREIFNILFTSKYITNETYFGISYQNYDVPYRGHFLASEFLEYSNNTSNNNI
jgi:hypothetical protein